MLYIALHHYTEVRYTGIQLYFNVKSSETKVDRFVRNFSCFNVRHYIDILITVHVKRLHVKYDNLFMFQSHLISLKQEFRTGVKING